MKSTWKLALVSLYLLGPDVPCVAAELPVGYDDPASDAGGPALAGGLDWIQTVWPRTITFAERLAGGAPTVLFITNYSGVDTLHELKRRFPLDALHVHPDWGNQFPGREMLHEKLRSRARIDCFVLSRANHATIPPDVQYEMLRRVKDDGAGLLVVDCYDASDTLNPRFLGLRPTESGAQLIRGIPYEGLREWKNTKRVNYISFNYWNTGGGIDSEPAAVPYAYRSVEVSPFGRGRVVWVDTGTHWARASRDGRTLLPHIQQSRDMWVETDYYYSHTAKAILKACGRVPEAEVLGITPQGETDGAQTPTVALQRHGEGAFTGALRWQVRDGWGIVTAQGMQPLNVAEEQAEVALEAARGRDAGRQFLDLWILNEAGETVDWGSGFVMVDRGAAAPEIMFRYPQGAPRGADLEGTITVQDPPAGSTIRATLVDRHWREVGRLAQPVGNGTVAYRFPSAGLDGQIWTLKADLLDAQGTILSGAHLNITSPHTRATRDGFSPLMTSGTMFTPEEAARREYLRRLGFLAERPYAAGSALMAEALAWNDIQIMPFTFNVMGASDDHKSDRINDWDDPQVKAEMTEAIRFLTEEFRPFGHRGYNMTDDSAPARELTSGAYTTIKFHEWLREEYGGWAQVVEAWDLKPRGVFHEMARVHRAMIKAQYEAGNTAPWIDAQRFMQEDWVQTMERLRDAAREVNPDIVVGSDAGYYGATMAEVFGRLDYLAPYYSHRALKVAVSRGRMRRDGDYGACLGSYGEKPADMSGRRGQIWNVLLAGGTGFYYWMFGLGLTEDMALSDKHALYQGEVTEEVMSGIGELFTGARRIFHPVAILDSQTSAICDQLEQKGEPITSQVNSVEAFQVVLEDLGLNPHTITGPELAAGWLPDNAVRLLALPGVNSMSEAEVTAVREFVQGGGVVVADILPGLRLPNGNPRAEAPLADLFGVTFDARAETTRVRGALTGKAAADGETLDFGEALADPRLAPDTADALGAVEGAPVILVNRFGNGTAFLFNASFSSYATYRAEGGEIWRPWHEVMKQVTRSADVVPEFRLTSEGRETPGLELSAFSNGDAFLLGVTDLGCGDFTGARRPFEVALPGRFHLYDIRAGRDLGAAEVLRDNIPRNGHRAYALLPYAVERVTLGAAAANVAPGETLRLTLDLAMTPQTDRAPHVIRLEARDPTGEAFSPFGRLVRMPPRGPVEVPLTTAFNDPPGAWTFTATDISSGKAATATVSLRGGEEG